METQSQPGQKRSDPELSYFGLQAYVGTTKHMGGLETTRELTALCHIERDTHVLDVGCGAGATSCYLAKVFGCSVVGVDLRESMIDLSNERAREEGVEDKVEFRVADVLDLPFEDAHFDVVLCESVATFVEDKGKMVSELVRVVKLGGYVGLNEEVWLKPPSKVIWEIKPDVLTADNWKALLRQAGLQDMVTKIYKFDARREASQMKRYRFVDMWRMFSRSLSLYLRSPAFRTYMKRQRRLPRDVFEYLGYAVFVGRR
jgi:arsenite methyltransferase